MAPPPPLGVDFMDRDHAAIEDLFARVADAPDDALAGLFDTIAREIAAHFAREEAAMTEARVPILLPHIELHSQLLGEVERMRRAIAAGDPDIRAFIGRVLPRLVADHVATADTVTAALLQR